MRQSTDDSPDRAFRVHLENFEGPFDLLLQLISRHKMDVTEVALSRVTDEFLDHLKAHGKDWDLDRPANSSWWPRHFSTSRPPGCSRPVKWTTRRISRCSRPVISSSPGCCNIARSNRWRPIWPPPSIAKAVDILGRSGSSRGSPACYPRCTLSISAEEFAALAAKAFAPKQADVISLAHLRAPAVSVREQAGLVVARLRRARTLTFRALTGDSPNLLTTRCPFPRATRAVPGRCRRIRAVNPSR